MNPGPSASRKNRGGRAGPVLLVCACVFGPAGCASDPTQGYAFGVAHSADVRSVAVPVFDNTTYEHGLEMQLTQAISKEIVRSTPWAVTDRDRADTTLTGAITSVRMRALGKNQDSGLVQELGVVISVNFEWTDNRTGKTLVARRDFKAGGTFAPVYGIGERLETGELDSIDTLARDIVAQLRSGW